MTGKPDAQLNIEYVPIEQLNPAAYHPRRMSADELAALERSIRELGFADPVIVRRTGSEVIGGHQRLVAAGHLGMTTVPVVFLDISADRAKLLSLALNKISGSWDESRLAELLRQLEALPDLDVTITGFAEDEIAACLARLDAASNRDKQEEFDVEAAIVAARENSRVQAGELWALGRHRLLCGDATSEDDLHRLRGPDRVHLVVSDPPYNVDYQPERAPSGRQNKVAANRETPRALGSIANDRMSPADYQKFLDGAFGNAVRAMPEGGALYLFGGTSTFVPYARAFETTGIHLSSVIVWDKGSLVLTRKDYHSQYELIFYGWVADKPHGYYGGRKQTDIWCVPRENGKTYEHPTQKPLELIERAIENGSQAGELVLDMFAGSGTSVIASERTGRRCLAMEIDPRFCEVIVRRWEAFTGEIASRVS
jgi:DNA modification methylase